MKGFKLRSLDADLQAVMKAASDDFDWKRINFVLEAHDINCKTP